MSEDLITILTFDQQSEALVVISRLEEAGISVLIQDSTMLGLNPIFSSGSPKIKLQVNAQDGPKALELLKSWGVIE